MKKDNKKVDGSNKDKEAALKAVLGMIDKKFGSGTIMDLSDPNAVLDIAPIPTGSLALDEALGIGGVPEGRIIEIYGPESSGKTTLTLSIIAQAQKMGQKAAFIDAEHALDVKYAQKLGVKTDELILNQPDNGEQALDIVGLLVDSSAVDIIIIDSVAALTPKAEIEGEMTDANMGLHARMMSKALRKITANAKKNNVTIIFINQIRMKIGVMFGNPETTTGGNALKFYASVRMDIRRTGAIKDGETVIGSATRVKVIKNKVAPPFTEAEFEIIYGEGIGKEQELLTYAAKYNLIEKAGAWFVINGEKMQGAPKAKEYLQKNPEFTNKLNEEVRSRFLASKVVKEVIEGEAEEEFDENTEYDDEGRSHNEE